MKNQNPINIRDRQLLTFLREDGRTTLTTLSRKTHIPVSTIFEQLKRYKGTVIKKFTALLDFQTLGMPIWSTTNIKVKRTQRDACIQYLLSLPQVNSLYKINNGYDLMVEAVFPTVHDSEEFVEELETKFSVLNRQTFFIINEFKREGFLMPLEKDSPREKS